MQYIHRKPAKCLSAQPTKPDIVRRIADVFGSFSVFMARKSASTLPEEDFDAVTEPRASSRSYDESPLDARVLDLDEEGESPFLRGQKRVPVRRGALPRKAADRVKLLMVVLLVVGAIGLVAVTLYRYGTQSWRFRLDSSDNIDILGNRNVSRAQILETLGGDIDRNIFFVSLAEQKKQLEDISWVESASVMRFCPTASASNSVSGRPWHSSKSTDTSPSSMLTASSWTCLPGAQSAFSFPVILGMNDSEPLSTRAPRMKIYSELVKQLDSTGAHYSRDLSEVDVSDPDDVKVTVSDPKGAVLVHLRSPNFLAPFQLYMAHVQEWRSQYSPLDSLDLRFEGQAIVNPDSSAAHAKGGPLPPVATVGGTTPADPEAPEKKTSTAKKLKKH